MVQLFLSYSCPVFCIPFVAKTFFTRLHALCTLVESFDCICKSLFIGSQFYYIVLCVHFYARTILFKLQHLCNAIWNQRELYFYFCSFSGLLSIFEDFCGPIWSFPGGFDYKESACDMETRVQSLYQEDPLAKGMVITPVFLPG